MNNESLKNTYVIKCVERHIDQYHKALDESLQWCATKREAEHFDTAEDAQERIKHIVESRANKDQYQKYHFSIEEENIPQLESDNEQNYGDRQRNNVILASEYEVIYILTNEAMPDYVKVGKTSEGKLSQKIDELSNSSVPFPFKLFYACKVPKSRNAEELFHNLFDKHGILENREFFKISPDQARDALLLTGGKKVNIDASNNIDYDETEPDDTNSEFILFYESLDNKKKYITNLASTKEGIDFKVADSVLNKDIFVVKTKLEASSYRNQLLKENQHLNNIKIAEIDIDENFNRSIVRVIDEDIIDI